MKDKPEVISIHPSGFRVPFGRQGFRKTDHSCGAVNS